MPKRAYTKHSVGKPCMSEAYAKWNQNSEPAINTGGSDPKHPTRLANTGRDGGNDCTRPTLPGCGRDRGVRPLAGLHPLAPDCGVPLPADSAQRAAQWMPAGAQRLPCCRSGSERARRRYAAMSSALLELMVTSPSKVRIFRALEFTAAISQYRRGFRNAPM